MIETTHVGIGIDTPKIWKGEKECWYSLFSVVNPLLMLFFKVRSVL
jgi:hypothetical protein